MPGIGCRTSMKSMEQGQSTTMQTCGDSSMRHRANIRYPEPGQVLEDDMPFVGSLRSWWRLTNEANRPRLHRGDERSRGSGTKRKSGRQAGGVRVERRVRPTTVMVLEPRWEERRPRPGHQTESNSNARPDNEASQNTPEFLCP